MRNKYEMMPYREWMIDFGAGSGSNIQSKKIKEEIKIEEEINYKEATIFSIGKTMDLFDSFKYSDFFKNSPKLSAQLELKRFDYINMMMVIVFMTTFFSLLSGMYFAEIINNQLYTFLMITPAIFLINLSTYIKWKYKV